MSEGNSPNVSEEEVKAESVEKDMESSKDMDAEDNVQEEEVEEPSEDKETEKKVELTEDEEPQLGLLERPVVIESGKREKRKVERLEISVKSPNDKQLLIPEGSGQKLGDSPRVEYQLNRVKAEELKIVHRALFDRPGSISTIKKNIRKFNGFDFGKDDKRFEKKRAQLSKNTNVILKKICEILDLERSGSKEDILNRLMDFLLEPKSSGKSVPKPKQKRKSSDGKQKSKAKKNTKKKSAPKKKTSDSSDSSDSEEENEKSSTTTTSSSNSSEESEESEEEKPKKKKRKVEKKKSSKKEKKVEKKKKPTPKKVEKKTAPKKRKISESTSDSSDDEPIIKKKKSPPSDDDIHEDVKKILEGANLEEVTMKTVIKQVYAKYPDFDLTPRKEFIKSTVKQIIS